MTHPEELLAGYVDGDLPARDRAAVDTHLAACSRCRGEVSLARSARSALGALPDVPAPDGIAARAIEESRGTAAAPGGGTPRWYRVAGIAAATAAALVVLTLTLPHIGQSDDAGGATRAAGTGSKVQGPTALSAPNGIEVQHVNYDNESLSALSTSYARDSAAAGGGAETTASPDSGEFATTQGTPKQTAGALACIQRSAPDATGQLTRLIRARFQGTPAYLALFLDGPGAGQPADTVIVWVFAIDDCRILSSSQAKL
jgi:hypothetical protein